MELLVWQYFPLQWGYTDVVVMLSDQLVFGRYYVGKDGETIDVQTDSLDWLITDD